MSVFSPLNVIQFCRPTAPQKEGLEEPAEDGGVDLERADSKGSDDAKSVASSALRHTQRSQPSGNDAAAAHSLAASTAGRTSGDATHCETPEALPDAQRRQLLSLPSMALSRQQE